MQQRGERVVHRLDHPGRDQRPGQVRASDAGAFGDELEHRLDVHGVAVGGHLLRDAGQPDDAFVAQPRLLGHDRRVCGVEQVPEQVHRHRTLLAAGRAHARELGPAHQPHAGRQRGGGRVPPAGGVVVGDRQHVDARPVRCRNELFRGIGPVGRRGVGVQVDQRW